MKRHKRNGGRQNIMSKRHLKLADYTNLVIPDEPEENAVAVPFPCPYYGAFLPKRDADELFSVLDSFPKDQQIAAHAPNISQPPTPTWKRVSGRLVVTFFDGSSEAAKGYINRFGDCGSFVYDWTQAPAELQAVRGKLAEKYGFPFNLVFYN